MPRAMDIEVAAHLPQVEEMADRLSRRHRDERDDLVQEGLISVWQSLAAGEAPSEKTIQRRMKRWLKYRGRQRRDVPSDYDKALKLGSEEELREVNAASMSASARDLEGRWNRGQGEEE